MYLLIIDLILVKNYIGNKLGMVLKEYKILGSICILKEAILSTVEFKFGQVEKLLGVGCENMFEI